MGGYRRNVLLVEKEVWGVKTGLGLNLSSALLNKL